MNHLQKKKTAAVCLLSAMLTLGTACGSDVLSDSSAMTSTQAYQVADVSYTESDATMVTFNGRGVQASGKYDSYEIDGSTFTITGAGTYVFTGSSDDGSIVIAKDVSDVTVVFNGLSLTSTDTAPLNSKSSEDLTLIVYEGSVNELSDADRSEEKPKGCLKTDGNLTIAGRGSLTINGNNKHGVKVDGNLTLKEATLLLASKEDGVNTSGDLTVTSGSISIYAGGDGMHSDGILTVGEQDAADEKLALEITKSEEGLEGSTMNVYSGNVDITADDDGINAAAPSDSSEETESSGTQDAAASGQADAETTAAESTAGTARSAGDGSRTMPDGMTGGMAGGGAMSEGVGEYHVNIYGGNIKVKAGGDGIDANGSIYVYGGSLDVSQSGGGNGIFDVGQTFEVTGGTVFGSGSSDMMVTPQSGENTLPYLYFSVSSGLSEGAAATITDSDGNVLWSGTIRQSANSVLFSSSDLTEASTYSLNINGSAAAEAAATTESQNSMGGGMSGRGNGGTMSDGEGRNGGPGMRNDSSGMSGGPGGMKGGTPPSETSGASGISGAAGASESSSSSTGAENSSTSLDGLTQPNESADSKIISEAVEV